MAPDQQSFLRFLARRGGFASQQTLGLIGFKPNKILIAAFYDLLLDLHKIPRALKTLNPKGVILGLHWDNGKENGNYYLGFRLQGPNSDPYYNPY